MSEPAAEVPPGSARAAAAARNWPLAGLVAVFAAAMLLLSVGAFWPRYLAQPFIALDRYTHLHAVIGTTWLLLLIAQPLAVLSGRMALHRALGTISYCIALAFVVSGVLLAHHRFAAMDQATFVAEAFFLYLPVLIGTLFALAVGLGYYYRHRRTDLHARFMGSTALLLIDPVIVRLLVFNLPLLPGATSYQLISFGLTDLAYVALVVNFRPSVRRPAALWLFFALMVVAQGLWFTLPFTDAWLAFAHWFRALPLT